MGMNVLWSILVKISTNTYQESVFAAVVCGSVLSCGSENKSQNCVRLLRSFPQGNLSWVLSRSSRHRCLKHLLVVADIPETDLSSVNLYSGQLRQQPWQEAAMESFLLSEVDQPTQVRKLMLFKNWLLAKDSQCVGGQDTRVSCNRQPLRHFPAPVIKQKKKLQIRNSSNSPFRWQKNIPPECNCASSFLWLHWIIFLHVEAYRILIAFLSFPVFRIHLEHFWQVCSTFGASGIQVIGLFEHIPEILKKEGSD